MADVTRNSEQSRYEISDDGQLAGVLTYEVGGRGPRGRAIVALTHTVIEPAFEGRGLASQMVRYALDDIRSEGYRVDPVCSYVQSWIGKHPEYADMVVEGGDADAAKDEGDPAE